jgi:hypothetical protein
MPAFCSLLKNGASTSSGYPIDLISEVHPNMIDPAREPAFDQPV